MIQRWAMINGMGATIATWTVGTADEPRGKALPPIDADLEELMAMLGIKTADPAKLRKLKELEKGLGKILHIANQIPSSGIRNMLMELFNQIVQMAKDGNLQGAVDMAKGVGKLAEDCLNTCRHINTNITTLKNPVGVQGPAKILLQQIAQLAKAAMAGAGSLQELDQISRLTDKAVEIAGELRGVEPGTKEYRRLMGDLQMIAANLAAMVKPGEADVLLAATNRSIGMRRKMDELREQTSDPVKREKLDKLEELLARAIEAAGPRADEEGFRKQLNAIMTDAAQGKLDEALANANKLAEGHEQLGKLHKHLEKKQERLEALLEKLDGPAKERLEAILDKAKRAGANAQTPEELLAIDNALMQAIEGADALAHADPCDAGVRSPGYLKLLGAERALDNCGCLPKGENQAPKMGRDSFAGPRKPGTGPVAATPGQSPGIAPPPDVVVDPIAAAADACLELTEAEQEAKLLPGAAGKQAAAARKEAEREVEKLRAHAGRAGGEAVAAITLAADRAAKKVAEAKDAVDLAHARLECEELERLAKELAETSPGSDKAAELIARLAGNVLIAPV